jgi:hypothetical protein
MAVTLVDGKQDVHCMVLAKFRLDLFPSLQEVLAGCPKEIEILSRALSQQLHFVLDPDQDVVHGDLLLRQIPQIAFSPVTVKPHRE